MIISHTHKIIYYAPWKTGTSAIANILENRFDGVELGHENRLYPRHHMFLPAQYEDYFTFVTVRNPYRRFLSYYNFICMRQAVKLDIFGFAETYWYQSVSRMLKGKEEPARDYLPIRIDAVLKTESLERDFNKLPFVRNRMDLPVLNQSALCTTALPDSIAGKIADLHHEDFEAYGYSKTVPFPCLFKMQ